MEKPEVYALSRIDWQFFLTLTFVRENLPDSLRRKLWFAYVRTIAENFDVHFRCLVWLLRTERGELNGRFHYHALLSGLPPHVRTSATCFAFMAQWERLKPQTNRKDAKGEIRLLSKFCGMARVRVYNASMDGLDYFLPERRDCSPVSLRSSGADTYEARKFGTADTVEFSESCARVMAARHSRESAMTIQHRQSGVRQPHSQDVPGGAITRQTPVQVNQARY